MQLSRIFWSIVILLTVSLGDLSAQNDPVLFSVGGKEVTKSEFEYVYGKSPQEATYTETSLREYLELYTNFKLKVMDAEALKLDTLRSVRQEMAKYQNQLLQSNIDKQITNELLKDAYARLQTNVKIQHMFFRLDPTVTGADTMRPYNRANEALQLVNRGTDFATVAKEYSHDPSAKENGGMLGWITAGQLPVIEFEQVAFRTPVGQTSKIFSTKMGYHIVKVLDKKQNPGSVTASHILVKYNTVVGEEPSAPEVARTKALADAAYARLMKGESWTSIVTEYSDDKTTKEKDGLLGEFGIGQMVEPFEKAAFALNSDGSISRPVQTPYGWHIIRREARTPVKSFEEMKQAIKPGVKKSSIYKLRLNGYINYFKDKRGFQEFEQPMLALKREVDSTVRRGTWLMSRLRNTGGTLFTIGGETFSVAEFANFLEINQRRFRAGTKEEVIDKAYIAWQGDKILDFSFRETDPNYDRLKQEYRDGILLFELTERNVWKKAIQDEEGLMAYYERNKDKYPTPEPVDPMENPNKVVSKKKVQVAHSRVFTCDNEMVARQVMKDVKKGRSIAEIQSKYKVGSESMVDVGSGSFGMGENSGVDKFWKIGISKPIEDNGKWVVVQITNFSEAEKNVTIGETNGTVNASASDALNNIKGYVIADYQAELEAKWINELRAKYPVQVNDSVLRSMIRR